MEARYLVTKMVDHTSGKHSALIQKFSEPLKRLGIDYFCYQFVSHDGDWFTLGSHPEWLHYCAETETHRDDPSLLAPEKMASGIYLPDTHDNQIFQKRLVNPAVEKYDIAQCLAISKTNEQGSVCFFFAGSHKNHQLMATYLRHIHLLKQSYINYVEQEICPIYNDCLSSSVNLKDLNNPIFLNSKDDYFRKTSTLMMDILPWNNESPEVKPGVLYRFGGYMTSFTPREAECINLLLNGCNSAKAIAQKLNLSYRTVEEYLTNIRQKTGCRKTLDLIKAVCLILSP